ELPPSIISLIRNFKCRNDISPVLLIRNLPTDDNLTETPSSGECAAKKTSFISESCLTGFSQLLGDVYGYVDEKEKELIHNICPVHSKEKAQSNESSLSLLHFHIEDAYFDFRPDYLSLFCLRADHDK